MNELPERIEKLEMSQAFTERQAETVAAELLRAFREIERLSKRLELLELRLRRLNSSDSPGPIPPADDQERPSLDW